MKRPRLVSVRNPKETTAPARTAPPTWKHRRHRPGASFYMYYKTTVELLKVVLWPALVLYLFLALRAPLVSAANQLPGIFYRTSHITIAGVTIDVDPRLQSSASPQVQQAVARLSADALRVLIITGDAEHTTSSTYPDFVQYGAALKELDQAGLITLNTAYVDPQNPGLNVHWVATDLGKQAYDFVVNVALDTLLRSAPAAGQ